MTEHLRPVIEVRTGVGEYDHDQIQEDSGAVIIGVETFNIGNTPGNNGARLIYLCRSQSLQFCPNCAYNNLEKGRCIKALAEPVK